MAPLNYAKEYARELAQAYPFVLYFGRLWTATKPEMRFINGNTIELPSLTVNGRANGDRDTIGTFGRNFNNAWETKTLKYHRTWNTLVHPRDINETNHVASIANITKVFNEEQKFPEMDAIALHELFALKNAIEAVAPLAKGAITVNNVLTKFDELMDKMDEARVPSAGRLLYVDTFTKTLIDNAIAIQRQTGQSNLDRNVSRIDEVEVISVPTVAMKTAFVFDPTAGFEPSAAAANLKMFLVHPSAIAPAIVYEFAQLEGPTALSQGKWVYFEESHENMFIYDKKHDGLQFITESAV